MDNARIHHSKVVKGYSRDHDLPFLYSKVASCEAAPFERIFALVKRLYTKRSQAVVELTKKMSG